MTRKKASNVPPNTATKPAGLAALEELTGRSAGLDPKEIDPTLLWMAVVALVRKGAAFQIACTRGRTGYVLTLFDGDFPFKQYLDNTAQLHRTLIDVVKAYEGKGISTDWEGYLINYQFE